MKDRDRDLVGGFRADCESCPVLLLLRTFAPLRLFSLLLALSYATRSAGVRYM